MMAGPEAHLDARDDAARSAALDPGRSFVVSAPAGSGKTELLVRRFLALLATVDEPEEVVAITFTRKATGELRSRVVAALQDAGGAESGAPAEALGRLGAAVRRRDQERNWDLAANPNRLAVYTIDGLCNRIARQLPLTARIGMLPRPLDDAGPLYLEAARRTLAQADTDTGTAAAWTTLLGHCDNDVEKVIGMVADMLGRREQWLPMLLTAAGGAQTRKILEDNLAQEVALLVAGLEGAVPPDRREAWLDLSEYARDVLGDPDPGAGAASPEQRRRALWSDAARRAFTAGLEIRRGVDRRCGFPVPDKASDPETARRMRVAKQRMIDLLDWLRGDAAAQNAARWLARAPAERYTDSQWKLIGALLVLLHGAAALLGEVTRETGTSDHTATTLAALEALGTEEDPTDLLLAFDNRVRHWLVDEFQDTSALQSLLLQRLTAGWMPGDGRTVFLVGDAMQSIYRFRQAQVSLFRRAGTDGIGDLRPEALTLGRNFRSAPDLVEWVNRVFPGVFAGQASGGAEPVPFVPAVAARQDLVSIGVRCERFDDFAAEARRVVELVAQARAEDPQGSVAVLVRARPHLGTIAGDLRAAGFAVRAVEIDSLAGHPAVLDLLMLSRALRRAGDRLAWLAVLRSPLVGLESDVLLHLAGEAGVAIGDALAGDPPGALPPGDLGRLARAREVFAAAARVRGRLAFATLVERVWHALGGPALAETAQDCATTEAYFAELARLSPAADADEWRSFERRVASLHAPAETADAGAVQLMTIHKAKGLQFDTVVVPGLWRRSKGARKRLLHWRDAGLRAALLAPIAPGNDDDEPIARYLADLDRAEETAELARVAYVAATRARRALYLLATGVPTGASDLRPPKGSLGAVLEPGGLIFVPGAAATSPPGWLPAPADGGAAPRLRRIGSGSRRPDLGPDLPGQESADPVHDEPGPDFDWAQVTARHVGTLTHRMLMRIAQDGPLAWPRERLAAAVPGIGVALTGLGVPADYLPSAVQRVGEALARTLDDAQGRWALDPGHRDARSEWALTAIDGDRIASVVIDRSFVTADGTRWIIDFKTSSHEGGDREGFLDNEVERYRPQLARYARVVGALEARPTRAGLYFPLLGAWREWSPQG